MRFKELTLTKVPGDYSMYVAADLDLKSRSPLIVLEFPGGQRYLVDRTRLETYLKEHQVYLVDGDTNRDELFVPSVPGNVVPK